MTWSIVARDPAGGVDGVHLAMAAAGVRLDHDPDHVRGRDALVEQPQAA